MKMKKNPQFFEKDGKLHALKCKCNHPAPNGEHPWSFDHRQWKIKVVNIYCNVCGYWLWYTEGRIDG